MIKEGVSIKIRLADQSDLDAICEWENNQDNWFVSNTNEPYTAAQVKHFLNFDNDLHASNQCRFIVLDKEENKVGCVDLFEYDETNSRVGIGILIDQNYRGRGYAKEAVNLTCDFCFESTGVHGIFAEVNNDNPTSIRLFLGCDFTEVGRKKDWMKRDNSFVDQIIFQRFRK